MSDNIVLSVKNIAFSINQNRLFHNLSFDLEQGKALHIKGNNGSGKSSLLRIILGITFVLKGEILWLKDLNKIFLGHKNVLKNHLTVADNLYLHGIDILNTNVKSTLEELGLYEKIDLLVGNLSYGQQKKLALVRVLLNNSSVIILDEPCVGLDDEARVLISKFLNSELKKNKSIIFTSHIPLDVCSDEIFIGNPQ
ncbi:heme ABC exporter ATP-binding protein CcmA [Gammaproteobacteria bacterium]|jgi:heme exporter protein A|nr:heme ABC exporter ATP-binding protein CcmA [Gammaproteobacteria bacterium]MDB4059555.1 heme ABC exporter ATP-binding protein CcmA [Gammaproteobacteria bacterium]MDB4253081.1 heme ABC exporter ATP-binding protein CcmA [Gammaproteobacteria bacterium]|tara:strand:+ start:63 stop:650 length:588 start_codon:yes stop_codon:yes gene_type:complete